MMSTEPQTAARPAVTCRAAKDEHSCREVELILRASSHCELRQVTCRFQNGTATLTGQVSSYYLKQIAQTIVHQLPQVTRIDNQLCVVTSFRYPIEP